MSVRSLALAIGVAVVAGCSPNPSPVVAGSSGTVSASTTASVTTSTISTTTAPTSTTATTFAPPATTATSSGKTASTVSSVTTRRPAVASTTTTAAAEPAGISRLTEQRKAQMTGVSWHTGCPVALDDLRLLNVVYVGFDGVDHTGQLIVHKNVATAVLGVFTQMHAAGFRIEKMQPIDAYGGSDDASVEANNTSAFNCRAVTGGTGWSRHAYGRAIDINPQQNPYVYADGHVSHPNAARYTDRTLNDPGMIHDGDVVTKAFAAIGWRWGGHFAPPIDYQHFDTT